MMIPIAEDALAEEYQSFGGLGEWQCREEEAPVALLGP